MTIEISSPDPETKTLLQKIVEAEPDNIVQLPIVPMEGHEVLTLVIENFDALGYGTAALIVALKSRIECLKITEDGLELSGPAKEQTLNVKR